MVYAPLSSLLLLSLSLFLYVVLSCSRLTFNILAKIRRQLSRSCPTYQSNALNTCAYFLFPSPSLCPLSISIAVRKVCEFDKLFKMWVQETERAGGLSAYQKAASCLQQLHVSNPRQLSLCVCVCVRACACHKIASRAAWPPQKLQLDWILLLSNNQDLLAANYFWPRQTETKMKAGRIFNLHAKWILITCHKLLQLDYHSGNSTGYIRIATALAGVPSLSRRKLCGKLWIIAKLRS